jgi:hypothetical protein
VEVEVGESSGGGKHRVVSEDATEKGAEVLDVVSVVEDIENDGFGHLVCHFMRLLDRVSDRRGEGLLHQSLNRHDHIFRVFLDEQRIDLIRS